MGIIEVQSVVTFLHIAAYNYRVDLTGTIRIHRWNTRIFKSLISLLPLKRFEKGFRHLGLSKIYFRFCGEKNNLLTIVRRKMVLIYGSSLKVLNINIMQRNCAIITVSISFWRQDLQT